LLTSSLLVCGRVLQNCPLQQYLHYTILAANLGEGECAGLDGLGWAGRFQCTPAVAVRMLIAPCV
jgi:hypothetical protein